MLDKFIQELTKELAIVGSLATDKTGVYAFPVDEETSATIKEESPGFSLSYIFPEYKLQNEGEFFAHVLHANLYGQGTKGAILGLDSDGKRLTLSKTIDYNSDYQEFKNFLEDFLNSIDLFSQEIKAHSA